MARTISTAIFLDRSRRNSRRDRTTTRFVSGPSLDKVEDISITVFCSPKRFDFFKGFDSEVSDGNIGVINKRSRAWLENIVVILYPCFLWQRVGVEQFVTRLFCCCDVLLNRLHIRISRSEELSDRIWNFVSNPAKLADYRETVRPDRFCPSSQRVCETNVICGAFRPKQINFGKDARNVFHIHAMRPHQLSKTFLFGTLCEPIQERLIRIYCVNGVLSSSASTNVWRPAPQPASTTTSKRWSGRDRNTYRLRLSSPGLSLSMPAKKRSIGFGVFIRF